MSAATGSLRVDEINPAVELEDTSSCLEFLLVSFHRHFQLTLQEAAGLLTQGGKYLAHVLAKGLKGQSDPVVQWYQALYSHAAHLVALMQAEAANGSVQLVLSGLKPGFISQHFAVVQACFQAFGALADLLQPLDRWEWFVSDGGGLECVLLACRRFGAEVKSLAVDLLVRFGTGQFTALFTIHFKQLLDNPLDYLTTLNELLQDLYQSAKEELVTSGVFQHWIELTLQLSETGNPLQLAAVNFLADLWLLFSESVDDNLAESVLNVLRKGHRDRSFVMKSACLGKLFQLLVAFTEQRTAYAPTVYKSLAFALVENYQDLDSREFILANFMLVFQTEPSIPVGVVVDPLIKQLQVNPDLDLSIVDFDFFNTVIRHPRLTPSTALQVMDVLARLCAYQLELAHVASQLFMQLLDQYQEDEAIREFVVRFVQYACKLASAVASKRLSRDRLTKILASPELTDLKFLVLQRNAVLDLVTKILELKIPQVSSQLLKEVLKTNASLQRTQSKPNPAMLRLLITQGNPSEFIEQYERGKFESPEKPKVRKAISHKAPGRSAKLVAQSRVEQELAKARQKSEQRVAAQRNQAEKEFELRQPTHLRKRLEVMVVDRRPDSILTEIEGDSRMLGLLIKRYHKALKDLFRQYSSTGYTTTDTNKSSFDLIVDKNTNLSVSEFYRMLKEHGVTSKQMSLEAATALIKEFCHARKKTVLKLGFHEFVELLTQSALYIFGKPPLDYSLLPPEVALQTLIRQFRKHRALQGMSTAAYDEPHPGFGDREVIHRLNQMLLVTPQAELPKGFKKVMECEVEVQYKSPARLPPNKALCVELLDDLLHAVFGVHILEPQLVYTVACRAKGVLPKIQVRKAQERNSKLSDQYHMSGVGMTYHAAKYETTIPAELDVSPALKFEIARLSNKHKLETLIELGKTLEDILYSVQINSSVLLSKGEKPKIFNRALALRAEAQQQAQVALRDKERKRRRRQARLEHELQAAVEVKHAKQRETQRKLMDEQLRIEEEQQRAEALEEEVQARKAERVRKWKQARAAEFQERIRHASLEQEEEDERRKAELRQFLRQEQAKLRSLFVQARDKHSITPVTSKTQLPAKHSRSDHTVRKKFSLFF